MGPLGPFWGPSGPRTPDGFGILGSRSDEIVNSINSATFFLCPDKEKMSHILLIMMQRFPLLRDPQSGQPDLEDEAPGEIE